MKNSYKALLLAALGLSAATAAQAQGLPSTSSVLLGFTDTATTATAQNDYVLSIGTADQFNTTANLSGSLSSSSLSAGFGSVDTGYLNDVNVGLYSGANSGTVFGLGSVTTFAGVNVAGIKGAGSLVPTVDLGEYSAAQDSSTWTTVVEKDPATGAGTSLTGSIAEDAGNIMGTVNNGTVSLAVYQDVVSGTTRSPIYTVTEEGTLTVDLNSDTWSFQGANVAVPEPTTYGLLAGAGLLVVSLRRQFVKKNA